MITLFLYNDNGVVSDELELDDKELQLAEILEQHSLYRLNWETHIMQKYPVISKALINVAKASLSDDKLEKATAFFTKLKQLVDTKKSDVMLEMDLEYILKGGTPAGGTFYFDMREEFTITITDTTFEIKGSVAENEY